MTLRHLPMPLLGSVLGLGGLGLAWRAAAETLGLPALVGEAVMAIMALDFAILLLLFGLRAARNPGLAAAEFAHPLLGPFFSLYSLGGLLLAAAATPYWPMVAVWLWEASALLQVLIGAGLLARWLAGRADPALMAPPLIIPFVANLLAAAFGAALDRPTLSWLLLGLGLLSWLPLQTLLLHRLLAGPPLPAPARPGLMIMVAPPSIAAIALMMLEGHSSPLSLAFAALAGFLLLALGMIARGLVAGPFTLAWWSFTFPMCAFAVMLMRLGPEVLGGAWAVASAVALAAATGIVLVVGLGTLRLALSGALLRPPG